MSADAKYRPTGAAGADVAGVGNATSGSLTDRLTREHRMTADEARQILNVKKEDSVERIMQVRRCLVSSQLARVCPLSPSPIHPLITLLPAIYDIASFYRVNRHSSPWCHPSPCHFPSMPVFIAERCADLSIFVTLTMQNYEHLFKANSPPAAPAKPTSGRQAQPIHSHYLQSKVVRARERLDAELKAALGEDPATSTAPHAEAGSQSGPTTPPPSS